MSENTENTNDMNDTIETVDDQVRTQFEYRLRLAGVSAEQVQEILAAIEKRDGAVTPEAVIAEAKDPEHPLHRVFEWNDEVAAHKFRVMQARFVIRAVGVRYTKPDGEGGSVRAFVNVQRGTKQYHGVLNAMHDANMRAELVRRAASELENWRARYAHLEEFARIVGLLAGAPELAALSAETQPSAEATAG